MHDIEFHGSFEFSKKKTTREGKSQTSSSPSSKKAPCLLVLAHRKMYRRSMASLPLSLDEKCSRDPRKTTVYDQTLLANIMKRASPLSSPSPQRRSCTGILIRSGRYQLLATPPTGHLHTSTNHQRPHTPISRPRSRLQQGQQHHQRHRGPIKDMGFHRGCSGRGREKTNQDGTPKEEDDTKRRRRRRDWPTDLDFSRSSIPSPTPQSDREPDAPAVDLVEWGASGRGRGWCFGFEHDDHEDHLPKTSIRRLRATRAATRPSRTHEPRGRRFAC
jgi:hypothetical protein